jgi:toxin YoeB
MRLSWSIDAWEEYLFWQKKDKNMIKKINILVKDILRTPFEGLGKPERLRANLSGLYSRRITQEHRLVYEVLKNEIRIIQCRYHYE